MSGQPYAVRFSAPAAKALDTLPEHVEDTVWDILEAVAADPWGFRQWNTEDHRGRGRPLRVRRPVLTYLLD